MKITFLGTGIATNETRYKTCIFVPLDKKNNLLIDIGGGTEILTQFAKAKIDPVCVNHIFITHTHFDHCLGLPAFLFYLASDRKEEMPEEMKVYSNKRIIGDLKEILRITGAGALDRLRERLIWIETKPEQPVKVTEGCSLIVFPAKGREELNEDDLSCLIRLLKPKKTILFTGDTEPNEYLEKYAKNVDILIHEASLLHERAKLAHRHGHSTSRDAGELAQRAGVKHLILTHIHRKSFIGDERLLLEEAQKYFAGPIHLAHDLETIEI